MNKTSGIVKAVLIFLLPLFLLTSCGPKEYKGFNITKVSGVPCVELPSLSEAAALFPVPLSYYQISEAHIKNIVDIYNRFNLEADDTIEFYEQLADKLASLDSEVLLKEDQKSFERWKTGEAGQNSAEASAFAKKLASSIRSLVSVIKQLSHQDPLLNTSFSAEDFFLENAKTSEVKEVAAFLSVFYPEQKIISEFSERTPFVIDPAAYVDFPLAASVNSEGEATLLLPFDGNLSSFKMPRFFYEKIHSIAKKMANYYNSFSETDRQVVTELFEASSELNLLRYNLLDFFPTDEDKVILLDWLRYIVSLDRDDAFFLTGALASYCRAQWLYSYEIISVLDDINWNCSYYSDKKEAVQKTWNEYVYKKQDLLDALVFFEESFPDIAFIRSLE